MASAMQAASAEAVEEIKTILTDQWFIYDDVNEPEEKVARIKLILNWVETEQLLLTNHNRRKVVHMSYGEMINYLHSGVLKKLNPKQSAAETFKAHLRHLLQTVSNQNKKEKQIDVKEHRLAASLEYYEERKEELIKQLELQQQRAKKKKQRAMVRESNSRIGRYSGRRITGKRHLVHDCSLLSRERKKIRQITRATQTGRHIKVLVQDFLYLC